MKQLPPKTLRFEMTPEEATILYHVFTHLLEDDPYGEASKELEMDINTVVKVGHQFKEMLEKAT